MSEPDKEDTSTQGKDRREWKPQFLGHYQTLGTVKGAAEAAGIARSTVYEARLTDSDFAEAWDAIEHDTVELLERTAVQRALDGSDRLMEFMLKALRPTKYRDSLKIDGKISIATEAELDAEIEEFLAREREEKEAARGQDDEPAGEGAAAGDEGAGSLAPRGAPGPGAAA